MLWLTWVVILTLSGTAVAQHGGRVAQGEGRSRSGEPRRAAFDTLLASDSLAADLDLLERALEAIHPGYDRYTSRSALDIFLRGIRQEIRTGLTLTEFYREIAVFLAKIRCDHTKAEYPDVIREYRETRRTFLPFRFRLFGSRMYVVASEPGDEVLPPGTEVLSINGVGVSFVFSNLALAVPVDGWTDFVQPYELAYDTDLMGSLFDHLYPMFYGFPEEWRLEVRRRGEDHSEELRIAPIDFERWQAIELPGAAYEKDFVDAVFWDLPDDSTAYLSVATFVNYRNPIEPEILFGPIFRRFRDRHVEHLILDLRGCSGGSDEVAIALLRYLLDEPFRLMREYRVRTYDLDPFHEYLTTWNPNALDPPPDRYRDVGGGWLVLSPEEGDPNTTVHEPYPEHFQGKLTVLIGPGNASGATHLLAKLQESREVRFVGTATGGSAEGATGGVLYFLRLPYSGITVRIPWIRQYVDIETFAPGLGVEPETVVDVSAREFFRDEDPVLEEAWTP